MTAGSPLKAGLGGRIIESYPDGVQFEVGHVRVWDPPDRLVFSWRAASFPPDRETEVHVRFEHVNGGTHVIVEHLGWDGIPQEHAARHGFPLLPVPATPGPVVAGAARLAGNHGNHMSG